MPSKEFDQVSQSDMFQSKLDSLTEGNWECLQIKSPAGVWFLVPEKKYAQKYAKRKRGDKRAVFTRSEMHVANKVLKQRTSDECQEWLCDMIDVKEVLEGAVILNVSSEDNEGPTSKR